jgi:hypothetical protein
MIRMYGRRESAFMKSASSPVRESSVARVDFNGWSAHMMNTPWKCFGSRNGQPSPAGRGEKRFLAEAQRGKEREKNCFTQRREGAKKGEFFGTRFMLPFRISLRLGVR